MIDIMCDQCSLLQKPVLWALSRMHVLLVFGICTLFFATNADIPPPEKGGLWRSEDFPVLAADCNQFFFGNAFPRPSASYDGLVKLCQTQQHDGYVGPAVYATLYSTKDRIPVYSAGVLAMYPNNTIFPQPNGTYWERVSLALCNIDEHDIPENSISSRIGFIRKEDLQMCGKLQAINADYSTSRRLLGLNRGHLNPNAINFQDRERQMATFTLTNAAPQYYQFDELSWEELECMTKFVIFTHVPLERVYIVTGTLSNARDENGNSLWMNNAARRKNPIRVPGYYWKAVCYPGNTWTGSSPWSYVIFQRNTRGGGKSSPDKFMNVKEFSNKHFQGDLFGETCMAASMGPIENYFSHWKENVEKYCRRAFYKTANLRWHSDEI